MTEAHALELGFSHSSVPRHFVFISIEFHLEVSFPSSSQSKEGRGGQKLLPGCFYSVQESTRSYQKQVCLHFMPP